MDSKSRPGYQEPPPPRPRSQTPSSESSAREKNYHRKQDFKKHWPQWEQHSELPLDNMERYSSNVNLRQLLDNENNPQNEGYESNRKYKPRKKKDYQHDQKQSGKHRKIVHQTKTDSEISDDDTSQDANDLSEVESPPNKNKTEVKDNKQQQNRLEKEPTKEKPAETVKEVADKAEECKDKEDSDISNIVEPEANYMIGSDVDVDKLYSPRSDTTSGTNRKTPQQTKKSIPNEPPKTATKQDKPTEQTKPTVRPPVNKDNSSSESSNHIEVKATIHKPEAKDDPKVQKKMDTATKNPTKMNTADLSQSQAYKNLLGGVKPQGAKSSTAPILDDTTTEDELEMALAPKHHNKHQPMKFGNEDSEQDFDATPKHNYPNKQGQTSRISGGMGGVGGMGHPMPLFTGGGATGNNKQMSSGGGGGFSGGLGARGRLTHPAAHTAAVLALNSGSDGGNSPSKLVIGGDGNISAPEKDDDDFWD